MKILQPISIIASFLLLFSCTSDAGSEESPISGELQDGLRILSVEIGNDDLEYTVYRGDYIVFDFSKAGNYQFIVPSLEIDALMPKPETEKPYVKMKKSGDYAFTLGEQSGQIHVLEFTEPHYREITASEASEILANTSPFLLDVRTQGEFDFGHIEGADLLPVQLLSQNLDKLEQYKNEDILLYCQSGNRSTVAAQILIDAGFTNIYNLRYGIGDWIKKGHPVEK